LEQSRWRATNRGASTSRDASQSKIIEELDDLYRQRYNFVSGSSEASGELLLTRARRGERAQIRERGRGGSGTPRIHAASRNSRNAILMPSPQIRGRDVDAPKYMRRAYVCARARARRSRRSVCVNFIAGLPVATVTITYHVHAADTRRVLRSIGPPLDSYNAQHTRFPRRLIHPRAITR